MLTAITSRANEVREMKVLCNLFSEQSLRSAFSPQTRTQTQLSQHNTPFFLAVPHYMAGTVMGGGVLTC